MRFIPGLILIVFRFLFIVVDAQEDCFWQDNGIVGSPVRGTKDFHIMGILSAEDCKSECQADEDCDFWVWNGPAWEANINTCWLKSTMESNEIQVGKISGPKCCPGDSCYVPTTTELTTQPTSTTAAPIPCSESFMENTAVGRGSGNGCGSVPNVPTVEGCRAECLKVHECNFFIWNSPARTSRKNHLRCYLKRNDNNKRQGDRRDIGRISGPKTCDVEEGQNLDGDIESEDGGIAD